MRREPNTRPIQVLCVGRADSNYDLLWQQFQREGLVLIFARTQQDGQQMALQLQPQIVVVNAANSHFSGDRLCRTLGRRLPSIQRLLITEPNVGAGVPCEIHLARPFTVRKLRESVLKLLEAAAPHILRVGPLQLDLVTRVVIGPQGRHRLTPKQCSLLAGFMRRPNQVLSRKDLMERVWETKYLGDTRTLDVHVRWLRERIEPDPKHPALLVTERGIGYRLVIPELESSPDDPLDVESY
ncbi:MAG: response regulator transcription factor [Chloroflexi bacterium]|nr:response regulator transcription factor [Chloroflexota bacterium]